MIFEDFTARFFSVIVSVQSGGLHLHNLIIFESNNPNFFSKAFLRSQVF